MNTTRTTVTTRALALALEEERSLGVLVVGLVAGSLSRMMIAGSCKMFWSCQLDNSGVFYWITIAATSRTGTYTLYLDNLKATTSVCYIISFVKSF